MVTQRHYRLNDLKIKNKKLFKVKPKLEILRHISKRNCALLPYLNDESLHTLGEFIFNVIQQKVRLDAKQLRRVKAILKKDKGFYKKLVHVDTSNPLGYFRKTLKTKPQVGEGVVSLIATLAPLIASLFLR